MNTIPVDTAQRGMGAANNRVAILDAGAQYGKVISSNFVPFPPECNSNLLGLGH